MARVFYFTTAQEKSLFKENLEKWDVAPNLSNQNFHNKLVRAIALNNDVEVLSIRPINKHFHEKDLKKKIITEGRVVWHHIEVKNSRIDKFLFINGRIRSEFLNIVKEEKEVVITDTMNLNLLKKAYSFAKKRKVKIIGICTDNPNNISFTSDSYKAKLIELSKRLNGFIVLTDKINDLYNKDKPFVKMDGINEEINIIDNKTKDKYIFFGGSLMRKYGVYALISAFNMLKEPGLKLYLAGHHEEGDFKSIINQNPSILYLGAIDNDRIKELETNALLAVNPRPLDPVIDEYSIPSKTLEYLANGALTISVRNKLLEERYKDAIIWAETGDTLDLLDAMNIALKMNDNERKAKITLGEALTNKYTSFNAINSLVNELIDKMFVD